MKKYLFACILLVLPGYFLFAQKVEFGSENETKASNNQPFLLGFKDNELYVLRVTGYNASIYSNLFRSDGKAAAGAMLIGYARFTNDAPFNEERLFYTQRSRYYLERYDASLKQLSSKELDVEIKPKGDLFDFIKFALIGQQVYAFSYQFNESKSENILQAHTVSDEGVLNKKPVKISSYVSKNKYNNGINNHSYKVIVSPDRKSFLVVNSELEYPKGVSGKKSLTMELFDSELNSKWRETVEVPIPEREVQLEKIRLTNNQDIALLFKMKQSDKKDGPDDRYSLFTYFTARKQLEEYAIKIDDKFTNDINFEFDEKNNLRVAGFFSGKNKSSAEGFFYQVINSKSGEIELESAEPFSKEFIKVSVGAKKASDTDVLRNFHMRRIIPMPDGRVVLLAEKYMITYNDRSFEYNYEDIYVIVLNAEGNYDWGKKILKFQRTYNDGGFYNSFCALSNGSEVLLVYNANRNDPDDRMTNTGRATVYVTKVSLDESAKPETQKLFNAREEETIMVPKIFLQESDESVLFYNKRGYYFKYARVKV